MIQRTISMLFAPLLLAAAITFTSCSEDDTGYTKPATQQIAFEIGFAPQTRVATAVDFKSVWEDGDEIGLFAVRHNGSGGTLNASGNHIHNVKLTFNGTDWTPETPLYYPGGGYMLDFYAYHPYNVAATNPMAIVFDVQTNQHAVAGFKSSDFMLSTPVSDISSGDPVQLQFGHKLALLQVKVDNQTGTAINDGFRVTLSDAAPRITANLATGDVTPSGTPAVITLYPFDATTWRAIVPVAASAQRNVEFKQESPAIYNIYTGTFGLPAGKATELEITLQAN